MEGTSGIPFSSYAKPTLILRALARRMQSGQSAQLVRQIRPSLPVLARKAGAIGGRLSLVGAIVAYGPMKFEANKQPSSVSQLGRQTPREFGGPERQHGPLSGR